MALAASSNSAHNRLSYSNINLVPLRINVSALDGSLNIVDTLVLDRYCWPIPLYDPLEEALERNAEELTYMMLADLEVHGMGRTVRHFTGRIDLWGIPFHQMIKNQLMPQLRHVAKTTKMIIKKEPKPVEDAQQQLKRKRDSDQANDNDDNESSDEVDVKRKKKAALVPVRLRLTVNGIRIHDDFIWDLNVPQCPMAFAQSLANDLNLPDEAVVAIMTSIVEQLDGSVVSDTQDLDSSDTPKKNATAAWTLDHKVHMANVTQLLNIHYNPRDQQRASREL